MAKFCRSLRSLRLQSSASSFSRSYHCERSPCSNVRSIPSPSPRSVAVLVWRTMTTGRRSFASESVATESTTHADPVSSDYPLPTPPPGDFDDFPAADADFDDDMVPEDDNPPPDPDAGALFSPDEED